MQSFQKPRGTVDYFGSELINLKHIENLISYIAHLYGYSEIRTPIFEHTEVFVRSVGETSDIVTKEIYNFLDKSGREIALRPEGTAGVIRAVNENKLLLKNNNSLRLYYNGPIFRYERPQSGRTRQFHQFGFEILNTNNITDDIDAILLANSILSKLNIKNYKLEINCIGSINTRQKWIEALKKYFEPFVNELSTDSQKRLYTNPLRILDDKIDAEKEFVKKAPSINEFLTIEEKAAFDEIIASLNELKIKFNVNNNLVRGLDYYSELVFEFVSTLNELKGQSTICGGGRYNNLIKELGGIDAQGVGFAFGLERLLIQYEVENNLHSTKFDQFDVTFINLLKDDAIIAESISYMMRAIGIATYYDPSVSKLVQGFKLAERNQSKLILILGREEIEKESVMVKNQITMKQELVKISDLPSYLNDLLKRI